MKSVLAVLALLVVILVGISCRGKVTESEARQIAVDRFLKVCAGSKLDRKSYNGPVLSEVGGVPYAFEWTKKPGETGDGILISVDEGGVTNVSYVPKWASNARPEPK